MIYQPKNVKVLGVLHVARGPDIAHACIRVKLDNPEHIHLNLLLPRTKYHYKGREWPPNEIDTKLGITITAQLLDLMFVIGWPNYVTLVYTNIIRLF